MKSQKGITVVSLVIYVVSFSIIVGIIGTITTYFYNNIEMIDLSASSSATYNKLNLYILKQIKSPGIILDAYTGNPNIEIDSNGVDYITFKLQDGTKNTFMRVGKIIYFNKIKLCEDIEKFEIGKPETNIEDGKTSINITVQISNKQYKTKYVLE